MTWVPHFLTALLWIGAATFGAGGVSAFSALMVYGDDGEWRKFAVAAAALVFCAVVVALFVSVALG